MVQFHCNKRPETAKPLTFFNRFPVRSETRIYSGSSSEKMAVCFTVISNIAALTRVPINKKRAHLFITDIFQPEQRSLRSEIHFQITNCIVLLKLSTKRYLN